MKMSGYALMFFNGDELKEVTYGERVIDLRTKAESGTIYVLYDVDNNFTKIIEGKWKEGGSWSEIINAVNAYDEVLYKKEQLETVLCRRLTLDDVDNIQLGWAAFYVDPIKYAGGIVPDMVNLWLDE